MSKSTTDSVRRKKFAAVVALFLSINSNAVILEETKVSPEALRQAQNIRDGTEAPRSVLGDMARSAVKSVAEVDTAQSQSCLAGKCNFVNVSAECVTGAICSAKLLSISGGPGQFHDLSRSLFPSGASANGVAGLYRYSVRMNPPSGPEKVCSGTVNVAGNKGNVKLRLYPDCRDAGIFEH